MLTQGETLWIEKKPQIRSPGVGVISDKVSALAPTTGLDQNTRPLSKGDALC